MNYYTKYIKYKLKYLSCIKSIRKLNKTYDFNTLEEKIKNNISLTNNFIIYLLNLNTDKKNIVLSYANIYKHQQILLLLS